MLGNNEIMARNIQYYMSLYGKTRKDVCKDLGFAASTFGDWVSGKKYPRIDKIEMLANYFHIQKSDLVEDHSIYQEDSDVQMFTMLVKQMTKEEIQELLFQAKHILDKRNSTK